MSNFIQHISHLIFSQKRNRFLLTVTLAAFGIRLAMIVAAGNSHEPVTYEHGLIAHNLYTGHGFTMAWPYESLDSARVVEMHQPPRYEGAFLPPINPYLMFGAFKLFGEAPSAFMFLMIFYSAVSAFIPLVAYRTGLLIGNEKSARLTALVALLFLPSAFAVTTYSGSQLYQLLGLIILFLAIQTSQHPTYKYFLLLGISCGVMTLLRSEFFLIGFVLIVVVIFLTRKKLELRTLMISGSVSIIICASIIAPWTYRNYTLFHQFIPVLSHPWYEIWRGNNELANGTTLNSEGASIFINPREYPTIIRKMDAIPYDQNFEPKVDNVFKAEVLDFVRDNPGRFLFLSVKKLAFFFTIDFNHPKSRNPFYSIPMIVVSALTVLGLYNLFRSPNPDTRSAAIIFAFFFVAYLGMTAFTVMLPRYQIYVFTSMLGVTGLSWKSTQEVVV
ncbi:MAG: hypothetical protein WCH46_01640 [bacterium]